MSIAGSMTHRDELTWTLMEYSSVFGPAQEKEKAVTSRTHSAIFLIVPPFPFENNTAQL